MDRKRILNILKKTVIHCFCLGCIAAAVYGAMFFIGYKFVEPATAKSQKYYINDIYDQPIVQLKHDTAFEQQFEAHGDIYGVQIRWHNLAQVQDGTALIEVLDGENGEVLASTTYNLHRIVNDVYNEIAFDQPYLNSEEGYQPYTLRITPQFENPEESYLKIWGDYSTKTIAFGVLKYIVNTDALYGWFGMLRTVALAGAVAVYAVCFIFRLKKETVFAVTLLAVSCLFTLVLPPYSSPDEEGHFNSAYRIVNKWDGFVDEDFDNQTIYKRAEDQSKIFEEKQTTVLNYEYIYNNLGEKGDVNSDMVAFDNSWTVSDFKGVYLLGAIGIKLGHMLNLGYVPMMYLGRLLNLLFFAVCVYFSVKITPVGKNIFMSLGLLPITLHIANSFSRDTFVISLGFLFTAYLLYLINQEETYKWWQLVLMAVICGLLAPSKFIYAVMCIGVCLLDIKKVPLLNRIKWKIHPFFILCAIGVLILPFMVVYMLKTDPLFKWKFLAIAPLEYLLDPQMIDFSISIQHILQNPIYFLKIILNTIYTNGAYYINSLFGGVLSYNSIYISSAFIIIIIVCVVLAVISSKDDIQLSGFHRITFGGIFALVFAEVMFMCITWTFVRMDTLYGFQGKYLLPVMPMLLIAVKGRNITANKDLFRPLCFVMAFTDIFVALNAFAVILQR